MKKQVIDIKNSEYGDGRISLASKGTPNSKTLFSLLNDLSLSTQKVAVPSQQI